MSADDGTAGYRPVDALTTVRSNRGWWDEAAEGYLTEHAADLDGRFVWGPELLDEADARLLGDVRGLDVLEVGCGAAQCGAWLAGQGARVAGVDLSAGMIRHAPPGPALAVADARDLPFAPASFDLAFSSYGAVPFVADPERIFAGVARVLRPGGRWVFSTTHPVRWMFPDQPGAAGLKVGFSYFDRTPYVETDGAGRVTYAEHHRTLGDRLRELVAAGFAVEDLVEPEWPDGLDRVWGGWSPTRGRLLPGTTIWLCRLR